ncbi:M23 family metallopeptidase [Flavobacterium eburneipallidum]|uniref:M23 family metallopeptidase n=1 Tax=Flavobacterium eburneipallidum TaxID=3003263 RepID=UPI00248220A2|nr:M23 family metallopeptidase [Flavobacterium eburneipallidum]
MRFYLLTLLFCSALFAQVDYPKDYFRSPLDIPMQLSGNFGELRPNHFHAGFDLKTLQREGLNVYAVADGYISRIKISTFGNGKTLYITHPNGYTSVYGHLQRATDSIEDFIKKTHYKEQSFEIEVFLKPGQMMVKKGQRIALSGNSGASEGPHLHFEFRDNVTEFIINPMLFGFDKNLKDSKKPILSSIYVYPLDDVTVVNQSKRPLMLNLKLQKDGTYLADPVLANGKIGFGINAFDYDDVSFNKNGVYKVQSFYNGTPSFGYQFDTYSFDEMRYINALIDYPRYKTTQQRVQKLFMKTPYLLSIIKSDFNYGVLTMSPNLTSTYRIEVSDFYGNKTLVSVPIQYQLSSAIVPQEPVVSKYWVKAKKDSNFEKDNMSVFFPAGTFYNDFNLNFDVQNDTLFLDKDTTPAHSNFTITIEDKKYTEVQREKLYIATINGAKRGYNYTSRKDNVFTTKVKTLGKYALVLDETPPKITIAKPIEGKWLTNQKSIQFSISDDLSGIKSYNGYLNGKWALFEYDNKTRKITHNFSDGIVAEGSNDLKIIVLDNLGNSTIFETRFFRSQKP